MRSLLVIAVVIFVFSPCAFSGEWSNEEIQQMENERKVYEETYTKFNNLGLPYQVWLKLSRSSYGCTGYDYFPDSGIRGFYCHLKTFIDMKTIEKYAGIKIFLSGPHVDDTPDFDSLTDFGHYNPAFLLWAQKNLIPATSNSQFLNFTQKTYNDTFSQMMRAYYVVGLTLDNNEKLRNELKGKYLEVMKAQQSYDFYSNAYYFLDDNLPKEFMFAKGNDFMYPQFETYRFEGNIVKTGMYFWLRRDMDGTFKISMETMENILRVYDKEFFNEFIHLKDTKTFYKLAANLDAEFSLVDLKKLSRNQLNLLRNGIYATYGYSFQNERLKSYFRSNIQKYCHNEQCGVIANIYNENNFSTVDKLNVKLIEDVENSLGN